MRCAAAGEIAETALSPRKPTGYELIRAFETYAEKLGGEPALAVEGEGAFAGFGLARDDEISTMGAIRLAQAQVGTR